MVSPPIRLVALDLDGVVYRGAHVLPGAVEAVEELASRGLLVRYVTNNATRARDEVAAKLREMGLPAREGEILSSAAATGVWLKGHLAPGSRLLVVGEAGLLKELTDAGFDPVYAGATEADGVAATDGTSASDGVRAVVVGLDRSFTYRTLARAQAALATGVPFVATNLDRTFPAEGRLLPGAGAIVAAVEAAAGRAPDVVIGKPGLELARALEASTGVTPGMTILVGDRLDTDIALGRAAGMQTVLVLSGVSTRADLVAGSPEPDAILESLAELPAFLAGIGV